MGGNDARRRLAKRRLASWRLARWLLTVVAILVAAGATAVVLSRRGARGSAPPAARPRASARSKAPGAPTPLDVPGRWRLILNAEFTGRTLDTDLWRPGWFGTGVSGPINSDEIACYRSSNVTLPGDGTVHLALTAVRSSCRGRQESYSGAVLTTNPHDGREGGGFTYRYGVLQAKIYIPGTGAGVANWPAVLTLGQDWPIDGEDDIMENLEGDVCAHFHSPGFAPGGPLGACDPSFTAVRPAGTSSRPTGSPAP